VPLPAHGSPSGECSDFDSDAEDDLPAALALMDAFVAPPDQAPPDQE